MKIVLFFFYARRMDSCAVQTYSRAQIDNHVERVCGKKANKRKIRCQKNEKEKEEEKIKCSHVNR